MQRVSFSQHLEDGPTHRQQDLSQNEHKSMKRKLSRDQPYTKGRARVTYALPTPATDCPDLPRTLCPRQLPDREGLPATGLLVFYMDNTQAFTGRPCPTDQH